MRFITACALLLSVVITTPTVGQATATQPNQTIRGSLIVVGGGSRPASITQRFIELAGGRERARILIIPLAGANAQETGTSSVAAFRRDSVQATSLVVTRAQADTDTIARALIGITGVWFPGGVQTRITEILRGTKLHRALLDLYHNGAVIGGTSAGAAIMSDSMLTGSQYQPGTDTAVYSDDTYTRIARRSIELVDGLGFLHNALVDQHFVRRERQNRLLSVVLERPHLLGAGIDEQTAIEVRPDGTWHMLGNSVVVIYDARQARISEQSAAVLGAQDVRMHILSTGGSFDPRTGAARLREP
ncbi:MAG: cyanophycinase [Longimicrobiales bacterium]